MIESGQSLVPDFALGSRALSRLGQNEFEGAPVAGHISDTSFRSRSNGTFARGSYFSHTWRLLGVGPIIGSFLVWDLVSSLREIVVIADLRLRLERLSRLKSLKVREQAPARASARGGPVTLNRSPVILSLLLLATGGFLYAFPGRLVGVRRSCFAAYRIRPGPGSLDRHLRDIPISRARFG